MLRVATRGSALARWQAERVGALLGGSVEYVLVTTAGDRDQRADLHAIGGTGVFAKEVQQAVLEGRADIAVHSAKDLPSTTPPGLALAVVLPQAAQGALGVECRADDAGTLDRLAEIDDPDAHRAVRAERAFLAALGGGCNLPCGALAVVDAETDELVLDALLATLDGSIALRTRGMGSDPVQVGGQAARAPPD